VITNRYHMLQTTKSWAFIGLPLTARRNLRMERDIIVGPIFEAGSWKFFFFLIYFFFIFIYFNCE
jgi:hypothetical protein